MTTRTPKAKAEWLQEALYLEQLGSEWEIGHAAAACNVSVSFMYRSDCPRVEKEGQRGTKGKPMLSFIPADVKQWNDGRTRKPAAVGAAAPARVA